MVSQSEESPVIRKERSEIEGLLDRLHENGVELKLDERAATPGTIASRAVCEDSRYMADFHFSRDGQLLGVYFDEVTNPHNGEDRATMD